MSQSQFCEYNSFVRESIDPRFTTSGYTTTLYAMQESNGVESILEGSQGFSRYVPNPDVTYDFEIYSWNRPTINWSLECEADGISRKDGLKYMSKNSFKIKPHHKKVSEQAKDWLYFGCLTFGYMFVGHILMCSKGRSLDK